MDLFFFLSFDLEFLFWLKVFFWLKRVVFYSAASSPFIVVCCNL